MVRTANRDAGVARRGKVCLKKVRQEDREAVSGVIHADGSQLCG